MSPFVTAKLTGQTGNLCFQIATASALAWDNGANAYFPDLKYYPVDYHHLFFRCNIKPPLPYATTIVHDTFPLLFKSGMRLEGYFQSEKHFAHHRQKILDLFAPKKEDLDHIKSRYDWIVNHPNAVGVQVRYYKRENIEGFPTYGIGYFEKAMALFPPETLFVVSSDNVPFAKANIPGWAKNVYYLENEPPFIDLFILSLCKHNIISNSTFGWWGAWLNQNPNKIVVRPSYWTLASKHFPLPICPEEWITINADPELL